MTTPKIPGGPFGFKGDPAPNVAPIRADLVKVRLDDGTLAFRRRGLTFGRFMIDADRTGLFITPGERRPKDGDDDAKPAAPPIPVESWTGLPVLLRCVMPKDRPEREGAVPSEIRLVIERRFPDGRVSEALEFNEAEIRKGEHLIRQGAAITGRKAIDDDARAIFAQLRHPAFAVPIETPWRHSGFTGGGLDAAAPPAYALHDGRAMLPGGKIAAGSIVGGLLHPKRRDRWEEHLQTLPARPPSGPEAATAIDALLTFDPAGRALCAAFLGARALFYSLRPMNVTCLLTGLSGSGKTTAGQIMHWAEGPCAAADEPDMSFRTTALGAELSSDRARDCVFLIDDGERVRPEPSAPLRPEIISLISNRTREAFDGAPAKVRGGRSLALAETRRVAQLLAFTAETPLGLEPSVLARSIWWTFDRNQITREPMLSADGEETPTWRACNAAFTGAGHGAIGRVLDLWSAGGRAAAIDWLRQIDLEANALAATVALRGEPEQRPRIQRGLAMIIAGAMLCDVGAGTENLFRDLARDYGGALAAAQLERLASGTTATVGFDAAWFRDAFGELTRSGDLLWLDASTGRLLGKDLDSDASELFGLGYQWRPGEGFIPAARTRGGWLAEDAYLAEPGALLSWLQRRSARAGGTFPFDRQTLPRHLVSLGIAEPASDGRNTHKPWLPFSDAKYPDKGARPRVLRIPFSALDAENDEKERDARGQRGPSPTTPCDALTIAVPASPPPAQRGDGPPKAAGREYCEQHQTLAPSVPTVPAESAQKPTFSRTNPRWPERAVVIDAGTANIPATLGDLATLAIEGQITQLWVHPSLTAKIGLPESLTPSEARDGLDHPFANGDALPAPWRLGSPGKLKGWNRVTSGDQEISLILSAYDHGWPFGQATSGAVQLEAIETFREAIGGFRPRIGPAVTFEAMLRSLHKGGTDLSASVAAFPKVMHADPVDSCWLTAAGPGAYVLAADKGAAYLAAMASIHVGFGEPAYEAAPAFHGARAGYWRATVSGWPSDLPPIGNAKGDWFVTPSLALAAQTPGVTIDVREAWLFPETHQPFQPVWRRLKAARESLQAREGEAADLALAAVKSLYTRGLGNLGSRAKRAAGAPNDMHRPDWRHFVMAAAQANIIRNLQDAGLRPFGLRTDAIYLMADTPDLAAAAPKLRQGVTPGAWRPIGAMPAEALPAAYRAPTPARAAQAKLDALTQLMASHGG